MKMLSSFTNKIGMNKQKKLINCAGHYAGMQTMKNIINVSHSSNRIRYLTLYAFSTENWTRPKEEVEYLINYLPNFFLVIDIR
jgi:undecaprenyl diphosphate synthase